MTSKNIAVTKTIEARHTMNLQKTPAPHAVYQSLGLIVPELKSLKSFLQQALKILSKSRAIVEIYLVGQKKMQQLNRDYRGKNYVPDVLSFPLDVRAPFPKGPWVLGEIVVCVPVARKQAKKEKITVSLQIIRLIAHGLVHLSGLDHEQSKQENIKFKNLEKKILKKLFPHPLICDY